MAQPLPPLVLRLLRVLPALVLLVPAAADTLKVFADDQYAPIAHLQDGQPRGHLVELLRRAEVLTGDHYDFELLTWKRAFELAKRGDGGLLGISYTPERSQWFDYSQPLFDDDIRIVVRKGKEFAFERLEDLQGKRLSVATGASYGEALDKAVTAGQIQLERDTEVPVRLRKLLSGRVDAMLWGNGALGFEALLKAHPNLLKDGDLVLLPTPMLRDPLHLAFAKSMNQRAAIERLDKALPQLLGKKKP